MIEQPSELFQKYDTIRARDHKPKKSFTEAENLASITSPDRVTSNYSTYQPIAFQLRGALIN